MTIGPPAPRAEAAPNPPLPRPPTRRPPENAMIRTLIALALSAAALTAHADEPFERVKVFLERNLLDKDAEVKFEVTGGKAGLVALKVVAPDGRTVIDFKAPDSKLGLRHLALESPEPANDGRVQADFPAGVYTFTGRGTDGAALAGKATLSHAFPEATAFVRPRADATGVPHQTLQIAWSAVKGLDAFVVVIVNEKSGREVRARLAASNTTFAVPAGFLQPATEYKLEIGSVAKDGNATFIETAFTTAGK